MDARRTVEAVWRMHSARLVASLTRLVQDLGLAEEVAQDAFLCALEQVPDADELPARLSAADGTRGRRGRHLMIRASL